MFEVTIQESFAAAHFLREYKGKCENLHGHNYQVKVSIRTKNLDKIGLSIDFSLAKKYLKTVLEELDHINLNDLLFFKENNPSAENIAKYIYFKYKKLLPKQATINKVTIWETENNAVSYWE